MPKNVLSHIKKLVIGSKRNPPPPGADCAEAGRPCQHPNLCQKQKQRGVGGEESSSTPATLSICRDSFQFLAGTCWQKQPCASAGTEGNFNRIVVKWQNHLKP